MPHPEAVMKMQSRTEHVFSDSQVLRLAGTHSGTMQGNPKSSVKLCTKLCLGVTRQITHLRVNCASYATLDCSYTHG